MNIGKFVKLPDREKLDLLSNHNIVKTFCSLCGKPVDGRGYCFVCHCFVCPACDYDNSKHICAGAK